MKGIQMCVDVLPCLECLHRHRAPTMLEQRLSDHFARRRKAVCGNSTSKNWKQKFVNFCTPTGVDMFEIE